MKACIASGSYDLTVRIWDAVSSTQIITIQHPEAQVSPHIHAGYTGIVQLYFFALILLNSSARYELKKSCVQIIDCYYKQVIFHVEKNDKKRFIHNFIKLN